MISQSSGNASHAIAEGNSRGIHFSKVISVGNGADLNESDYLEYLTEDLDTKIITAYAGFPDQSRIRRIPVDPSGGHCFEQIHPTSGTVEVRRNEGNALASIFKEDLL